MLISAFCSCRLCPFHSNVHAEGCSLQPEEATELQTWLTRSAPNVLRLIILFYLHSNKVRG